MRKVLFKSIVIILLGLIVCLNITCVILLVRRNYAINACLIRVYDVLIDYKNFVIYINTTSKAQTIACRVKVGIIREFKEEGYYLINPAKLEAIDDEDMLALLLVTTKGARITKPTEVAKRVLDNEVYIYTEDFMLIKCIEAIIVEF